MANITLTVPDELKIELSKHNEVNWSGVIRNALVEHIRKMKIAEAIVKKSRFTEKDAEELSKKVNFAIHSRLKKEGKL